MASGAIPLVFDAGGPPELIERGRCGLTWSSLDDLSGATLQIANDQDLCERLQNAGISRAESFSRENFTKSLKAIVNQCQAEQDETQKECR